VVITIDDDNFFVSGQDFVGQHCEALSVGSKGVPIVTSSSGWYNICEALREKRGIPFYHRGYPLEQRWPEHEPVVFRRKDGIHVLLDHFFNGIVFEPHKQLKILAVGAGEQAGGGQRGALAGGS
jgi:hypothetical protein